MSEDYRVRGSSIRSEFEFVRERSGAASLRGVDSLDWELSWDTGGARYRLRWA